MEFNEYQNIMKRYMPDPPGQHRTRVFASDQFQESGRYVKVWAFAGLRENGENDEGENGEGENGGGENGEAALHIQRHMQNLLRYLAILAESEGISLDELAQASVSLGDR